MARGFDPCRKPGAYLHPGQSLETLARIVSSGSDTMCAHRMREAQRRLFASLRPDSEESAESPAEIRARVERARAAQLQRFRNDGGVFYTRQRPDEHAPDPRASPD